MTSCTKTLIDLLDECWEDEELRLKFLADPVGVITENCGMSGIQGMDAEIAANTEHSMQIILHTDTPDKFQIYSQRHPRRLGEAEDTTEEDASSSAEKSQCG